MATFMKSLVNGFREGYFNVGAGLACIMASSINIYHEIAVGFSVAGIYAGLFSILVAPITRRAIARYLIVTVHWLNLKNR